MPVWALYSLVVAIWGSSWYAIELQLGIVAPQVSLAYRFALSAAILIAYCLATRRKLRFSRRAHLCMAAQGFCLFCANYILFYFAGQHLVSGLMAVCFSTISVMNIANLAIFFRRRVEPKVLIAALLGLLGLGLVFYPELMGQDLGADPALGLALSLAATYFASLGNMLSVKLKALEIPVVESNTIGMSYGTLFCLAFALLDGAPFLFDPRPAYVLSLIGLALFATVIGFGCFLSLVQRIGADRAAYASILFPVVALTLSAWLEDYRLSPLAGLGILLVLGGNVLVLSRFPRTQPRPA